MTDTTKLQEAAQNFIKAASRYLADEAFGHDKSLLKTTIRVPAFSIGAQNMTVRDATMHVLGMMLELFTSLGVEPDKGDTTALDQIIRPEIRAEMARIIEQAGGVECAFNLALDANGAGCRIVRHFIGNEKCVNVKGDPGTLRVHSHPKGSMLKPSPPDIMNAAAGLLYGCGDAICNTTVDCINVIVAPPRAPWEVSCYA